MGTKTDPGKYDCHGKAADDEPLFTLRAKDPIAPYLVELWRQLRAGVSPSLCIDTLRGAHRAFLKSGRSVLPLDSEKSAEASKVADAMVDWFNRKAGEATSCKAAPSDGS